MLSLEAIRVLPDAELHELVALHCHGWRPMEYADVRAATGCTHMAPDGGLYTLPEYSESWDLAMPLANQAEVTRRRDDAVIVHRDDGSFLRTRGDMEWTYHCYAHNGLDERAIHVPDTADDHTHCRALCELALWRAIQNHDTEER